MAVWVLKFLTGKRVLLHIKKRYMKVNPMLAKEIKSSFKKKIGKRENMHYLDMLAMQFNKDLLADEQQLCFIPHTFSDEDHLAELIQTMLHDLEGDAEVVRHHVLVLFETVGYQLTHIRAVMVTPSLDIAQNSEQDWSRYIAADESAVVEKVTTPNAPGNQPNRGLSLTAKAMARQKSRPKQKELDIATAKEN